MSAATVNGDATFDLEAAGAAAEAEAVPFTFTYKGKGYAVPPSSTWPMTTLRKVAAGDLEDALGELLGAKVYDQLCDAGLTSGELGVLFAAMGKQGGFPTLPNSVRRARPGSTRTPKRR